MKILVLNMCKYGNGGTHIQYVMPTKENLYSREKFKGYIVKEMWLPNQNWFDSLNAEDLYDLLDFNITTELGNNGRPKLIVDRVTNSTGKVYTLK